MNHHLLQSWLLRLIGSVELGAFVAVVTPRQWMETGHSWLGLGVMPDGAVVDFMIRQASFTYGLHGILLWLLSRDVSRFQPLVVFTGVSYTVAAPVFLAIDWSSGMPWFWTAGDAASCFASGCALLVLGWRARQAGQPGGSDATFDRSLGPPNKA